MSNCLPILALNNLLRKIPEPGTVTISITVLSLFFFTSSLFAQQQDKVTIKATATVVSNSEIELITLNDLVLDPALSHDGEIEISPKLDADAGKMLVKGKPEARIRLMFVPKMKLMNSRGKGYLTLDFQLSGFPGDNQQASEILDAVERVIFFNNSGEYYLWIGGMMDISHARPGSYEGEFTLEIEYL